jgi:hypothetical protein
MTINSRIETLETMLSAGNSGCDGCGKSVLCADEREGGALHCIHCGAELPASSIPAGPFKTWTAVADGDESAVTAGDAL